MVASTRPASIPFLRTAGNPISSGLFGDNADPITDINPSPGIVSAPDFGNEQLKVLPEEDEEVHSSVRAFPALRRRCLTWSA